MDPVTQVLTQQQSGSAGGQGFGQFYLAGRQDARQKQQLNLATRAENRLQQRQDAILPYEKALTGMQVVAAGQTAEANRMKLANIVTGNNALPEIMALENYFMESSQGFKDADGIAAYKQLKDRYPQAFVEGAPGHRLRQLIQMPAVTDWELQRMEQINQRMRGTGRYVQRFDERGSPVLGEQNPPARPDKLEVADEMTSLQRIIASPNTPPDLKQQAENQLANIQSQMGASSMEVIDPATGNVIMRQTTGRQAPASSGDATTANLTEFNKQLVGTDVALHELGRAERAVKNLPKAFGVRGVANEAFEIGKGIVDPNAPAPIADARNEAAIMFTKIADGLRVDTGNMSRYELNQLEKAGDITKWSVNPQAALGKIDNVRNALVAKKLRILQAKGQQPKDSDLLQIPGSELDDLRKSGLVDDDVARRWFKLITDKQAKEVTR